jgi:hypothetical protein
MRKLPVKTPFLATKRSRSGNYDYEYIDTLPVNTFVLMGESYLPIAALWKELRLHARVTFINDIFPLRYGQTNLLLQCASLEYDLHVYSLWEVQYIPLTELF